MLDKGYILAGGIMFPVVKIELVDRGFMVTGEQWGPMDAYSGPATLVGSDGLPIAYPANTTDNHFSWPKVRRWQHCTLPFRISFPRGDDETESPDAAPARSLQEAQQRQAIEGGDGDR